MQENKTKEERTNKQNEQRIVHIYCIYQVFSEVCSVCKYIQFIFLISEMAPGLGKMAPVLPKTKDREPKWIRLAPSPWPFNVYSFVCMCVIHVLDKALCK